MNRYRIHPIFYLILSIAILGFAYQLIVQPMELIKEFIIWAIVLGVIYFIYRIATRNRMNSEYSAFLKAAKKSKRRYKNRAASNPLKKGKQYGKTSKSAILKKKRDHSHLTVIEGKKNKKKNGTLF
jgi:thiosulfate reductase cytochrome b subunit